MKNASKAVVKFGKALREVRLAKEWTQLRLAEEAGLDVGHVSRIERGEKDLSLTTASRLAEAVGVRLCFGEFRLTK